jgi:hypothetical protein
MKDIAQATTSIAMGTLLGFLGIGAVARSLDAWQASQCPGVTRVQVNTGTMLKDWAAYGQCPMTVPLKP